jgi:hypothetical protein
MGLHIVEDLLHMIWAQTRAHDGEAWTEGAPLVIEVAAEVSMVVGCLAGTLEQAMTSPADSARMWLDVTRLLGEGLARGRAAAQARAEGLER